MNKDKNLVVFDLETTGLDKEVDHIIQISAVKVNKSFKVIGKLNYLIEPDGPYSISIQAYLKHQIHPNDLVGKPHLKDVADEIIEFFGDCDILTYNGINFDIPFLIKAMAKIGKKISFLDRHIYDAYLEERRRHGLTLEDTYKRYNNGKSMEDNNLKAHDALSDVLATLDVFEHQSDEQEVKEEKIVTEDNTIVNKQFNDNEQLCFNIGKYKDLPLSYVATIDQGYLHWCVEKASFMDTTKDFIRQYIK